MLAPRTEDAEKYASFANRKDGGLITLVADQGCDKDLQVKVLTAGCSTYTMPGAGSTYSFRVGDYRIRTLGDLIFTGPLFQSIGTLVHGIFVELGNIPVEQVSPETSGVGYLMKIAAATDMESAAAMTEKLADGIKDGNFAYQNYAVPKENTTYALRSIAYRGKSYREVQLKIYDEFDFDKRRDLNVVFRVIRLNGAESVTLVWKELAASDSPKIETKKEN